jgi:hypothetical protein
MTISLKIKKTLIGQNSKKNSKIVKMDLDGFFRVKELEENWKKIIYKFLIFNKNK